VIIRILGEGQFDVAVDDALNALDARLQAAVDTGDVDGFTSALHTLLDAIRQCGTPVPVHKLTPSELVLPAEDSSLDQVRKLIGDSGLIPG
jgi:hypothetical protein